jgi:predicted glycoside hydrolase/deacetylase ChbG (UPF0249 family)
MPGFAEACALVRECGLDQRVGVHVNLSEGVPLTDGLRSSSRFCDADGYLWKWPNRGTRLRLASSERRLVGAEVTAQIERCRKHGLTIRHLDSHHNVHTQPALAGLFIELARNLGIQSMRIARNSGLAPLPQHIYKAAYNLRLRMHGLAATHYFGTPDDLRLFVQRGASPSQLASFELVTHPVMREDGTVVDVDFPDIPFSESLVRLGVSAMANPSAT